MRRFLYSLTVLSLLASACGDDADTETGGPPATSTTGAASSSTVATTSSTLPPPSSTEVSPTVPTTTTEPVVWPGNISAGSPPSLVIAHGTSVVHYRPRADGSLDGRIVVEGETDHPVTHLHQASNGDVFVREVAPSDGGEAVEYFARYGFDGGRDALDVEWIFDVAVVNGVESVIVAVPSPDGYGFGGLEAWAVDDRRSVAELGLAAEAEFGVTDFDWSEVAGIGVASAWSDLTEWIGFVDASGASVDLPSPTDDLAYNSPPYVTAAAIDDAGRTLYWAEGPDWGFDPETNESGPVAAPWELRGADLDTGDTSLVWPLSEPVLDTTIVEVHSILPLGDFVIVNRTTLRGTESVPLAPLVLDFTVEEPELYEYPVIGIATIAAI